MSIEIGIDPILFSIGSFEIGWHGIMVVLAVIVGIGASLLFAKGKGIKKEVIYSAAPWAILGGIIGARLFHVIDYWGYYANNPVEIFQFWHGLSILGAILGGTLSVFIYAKITDLPVGRLADVIALALPLAQAVGRVGCTINGDAYGTETSLPWGFVYKDLPGVYAPAGVSTHPSPVYEIIWDLLIFAVLWRLRGRLKPDGSLFLLYLCLYSFGRFFIEFTRSVTSSQINVGELLHAPHFIALIVLAVCVPILIRHMRRARMLGCRDEIEDV
jgi:phosphatidylglycerol:prolipoprotein diacylglycerol transferase